MKRSQLSSVTVATLFALLFAWGASSLADAPRGRPATTASLGGAERYLAHLSTDKPLYREGETVYLRAHLLSAHENAPLPRTRVIPGHVRITGPRGDVVAQGAVRSDDSVMGFSWTVPAGQAGGDYEAHLTFPHEGLPPAARKFGVRAYRAPRFRSQIEFARKGYGPGDSVIATLTTERAEGGIPSGARVNVEATVDGATAFRDTTQVDASGRARTEFALPARIARGEGTLAFTVEDGGVVETETKTIPILLQTVDLTLYPEGGELIADLPATVYLEARTPAQKPADLKGEVRDSQGQVVATFETAHEGRGRFSFLPARRERYTLHVTEPSGIATTYPLPEVRVAGGVLSALEERTAATAPLQMTVAATRAGNHTVTVSKREVELGRINARLVAHAPMRLHVPLDDRAFGVLTATLWDEDGRPLAERLVFREPPRGLTVTVAVTPERPTPGQPVILRVRTADADGKPRAALVSLTVTDDSVLELIETREHAPRLPAMALLETEVRELFDAHVYLADSSAEAVQALDLLLGTQGWRRFAFVRPEELLTQEGDRARRVLALVEPPPPYVSTAPARVGRPGRPRGPRPDRNEAGLDFLPRPRSRPPARPADRGPRAAAVAPVFDAAAAAPPMGVAARAGSRAEAGGIVADQEPAMPASARVFELLEPQRQAAPARARRARPAVGRGPAPARGAVPQLRQQDPAPFAEFEREARPPAPTRQDLVLVREYAHTRPPRVAGDERRDFTETVYWRAGLWTDETTGEAEVRFAMNDSVTTFKAMVDAVDQGGALGMANLNVESVEPFYVEAKLPLEVTVGDRVEVPLAVINSTDAPVLGIALAVRVPEGITVAEPAALDLAAGARVRQLLALDIDRVVAGAEFSLDATAAAHADRVTRPLRIVPQGFPAEQTAAGVIGASGRVTHTFEIPDDVVASSMATTVQLYPSPLANLTSALERLIGTPHGCFEQTTATTYPMVMAQRYFLTHAGVPTELIARSRRLIGQGYDRLVGFECRSGGFEWFGADPGHEALTALGLLQFADMAKVHSVDPEMVARNRRWLLAQRDGQGGFKRGRRALHTWVADPDITNGYILWALLSSGESATSLEREIDAFVRAAKATEDAYVAALGANVLQLAGRAVEAHALLGKLVRSQRADGAFEDSKTSVVGSRGQALLVETTALTTLALLNDPSYVPQVEKAMRFLASSCEGGRFSSTQATVLALKAIVAYDEARARERFAGSVHLLIDDEAVSAALLVDPDGATALEFPNVGHALKAGPRTVTLVQEGGFEMPYSVALNYHQTRPVASPDSVLAMEVELPQTRLVEGGIVDVQVTVSNTTRETVPMAVAIVGLPGGLEPRHDQLRELVKEERVAAYEVLGREVVFYWRAFAPGEARTIPLSLVAAIPGRYTGPASRAYLYYGDEHKHWVPGLEVTIAARVQEGGLRDLFERVFGRP
jgi:alpha-2-macroglobulin-like protein